MTAEGVPGASALPARRLGPHIWFRWSARGAFVGLGVLMLISVAIGLHARRPPPIVYGDAPEYLVPAYNLVHRHVFSTQSDGTSPAPGIGREPGYPLFVAALMLVDPGLGHVPLGCLVGRETCDLGRFAGLSFANLILVQAAGLTMFVLARRLTRSYGAALVAAAYVLLNAEMNEYWYFPMSDWLAVFLVTLTMLALAAAWGRASSGRWCLVGAAFAGLTLTKAVFLPFCVIVAGTCVVRAAGWAGQRRVLAALGMAGAIYAAVVGGWIVRNWAVAGEARIADARGGIALSTREVFDHMTPAQYLAAFVYWTRGPGVGLARRLFGAQVVDPFDLDRDGGFYDRGQNGYRRRVDALRAERSLDFWTASAIVDHELEMSILRHPAVHAATTLPLLYRGFWIDDFWILGIPALPWMLVAAIRRRSGLVVVLLGIGVFNEIFYALFSLNVPRYQMTAIPSLALAAALASMAIRRRLIGRGAGIAAQRPEAR